MRGCWRSQAQSLGDTGDRMDRTTDGAQVPITRRRTRETLLLMVSGATLLGACSPTPMPTNSSATAAPLAPTGGSANQPAPPSPAASVATAQPVATSAPVSQAAPATPAPKPGGVLRVGNIDGHSWGPNNGFSFFMIYDSVRPMTHDGWSEAWWDDLESLHASRASAEWAPFSEDGQTPFAYPMSVVIAHEGVIK